MASAAQAVMQKEPGAARTYLSFAHCGAEAPAKDGFADGQALAAGCHHELCKSGDPRQFPPRLLILMASPKYLEDDRADAIVQGIESYFNNHYKERIPLIGSSVAAVCFDRQVHEHGAVLICLASKFLQVRVEAVDVSAQPKEAIETLCSRLGVAISDDQDPNLLANRLLLLFLPGQLAGSFPMSLYNNIAKATGHKLHMTGGVSHPVAGHSAGFQFTQFGFQEGAIVAARLEFGIRVASGLARSCLRGRGIYATRCNASDDPNIEFDNRNAIEEIANERGFTLLGKEVDGNYLALVTYDRAKSMWRKLGAVRERESLEALDIDDDKIVCEAKFAIQEPRRRAFLKNPAGAITFHCTSYYRYRKTIGLDMENALLEMEQTIGNAPIAGGFFDGEIGVADNGRSTLANWAGATLTFGDEMRERAVVQQVLLEIANFSARLDKAQSTDEVIGLSLEMVKEIGFPGAMISLVLPEEQEDWIIAQGVYGERFSRIKDLVRCRWQDEKLLTSITKNDDLRYIANWSEWDSGGKEPVWQEGLVSQYVIPLFGHLEKNIGGSATHEREVLGFLHIDLGNSSKKNRLHKMERQVLNALGTAVESSLLQVLLWEEAKIRQALDRALGDALVATSVSSGRRIFLEAATKAFGGYSAYIRTRNGNSLDLDVGFGAYHNAVKHVRGTIDVTDQSPAGRVFTLGTSGIVNDTKRNHFHRRFRYRYRGESVQDTIMKNALQELGSYAISVLRDQSEQKIGTVMIAARQPWHFHKFHIECVRTIGKLLALVTEHLEKTGAAEFIEQIENDLPSRVNSSSDFDHAINVLVKNLKRALGTDQDADVVCLFLWDHLRDRFVLRAQTGWQEGGWEQAASYKKHEGWTGSVGAADEPRYEKNLIEYKHLTGSSPEGKYEQAMMGGPPNGLLTAGIGLPLRAGTKILGVLTAFRRYENKGTGELFSLTDTKVLAQAANRISGYLSSLLLQRYERQEREKVDRREVVHRAVVASPLDKLEKTLCQQLHRIYETDKVLFYLAVDGDPQLKCVASHPGSEEPPDNWAHEVMRDAVPKLLAPGPDRQGRSNDPSDAALGVFHRALIPILVEDRPLGVLDLRWPMNVPWSDRVLQYGADELPVIAAKAGSVYQRHHLQTDLARAKEREKNLEPSVRRWASLIEDHARVAVHEWKGLGVDLEGLKSLILEDDNQDSILKRLGEIRSKAVRMQGLLKNMPSPKDPDFLDRVESMSYPVRERVNLTVLIQQAIDACDSPGDVQWEPPRDEILFVNVNAESIVAAFLNFLNNAIRSVNKKRAKKKPASIVVSAVSLREENKAKIVFKDTGEGMEPRQIEDAMDGKSSPLHSNGHGVGIPVAKAMLQVFGGTVTIESQVAFGTEVIVTLLLAPEEAK